MHLTQTRTLGIALILSALALGLVALRWLKQPPRYEAAATVKVERDKIDLPELGDVLGAGVDDTIFIETEIASLQSEATLSSVITKLDLNHVWGKRLYDGQTLKTSETLQMLKGRLQAQPGPETTLIIRAISEEAAEAAAIANTTAEAYCAYRADYRRRLTQNALDAVAGKFAEMEKKAAAAREKVEQAWQQLDPALREKAVAAPPESESEALRTLHARYAETVLRYLAQSNQLALYPTNTVVADEVVEQLKVRAEKAKAEMVAAETATRSEVRKQESLRNYHAARLEFEELTQLSAPLKKTVETLQNDLRPREHAPARIVEQAVPPGTPGVQEASRGRTFLAGSGLALALGIGLVLFGKKSGSEPA